MKQNQSFITLAIFITVLILSACSSFSGKAHEELGMVMPFSVE